MFYESPVPQFVFMALLGLLFYSSGTQTTSTNVLFLLPSVAEEHSHYSYQLNIAAIALSLLLSPA